MTGLQPALARFGDVSVRLSVELGRTEMSLRDVLALGEGSVVPLDRLTDELLEVTANGQVIARGEVVAENGRFALRIVTLAGEGGEDLPPSPNAPNTAAGGPLGAGPGAGE
jgi:flagellar motor switch protein FliN/FliY